jgi:tetratricopeptide (TPR) repeat protein
VTVLKPQKNRARHPFATFRDLKFIAFMRCAVVLALGDPRSSRGGTWIDAVSWLRQELTDLGFRVVIVDGEDVEVDLVQALEGLTPQDQVLLHVSGHLDGASPAPAGARSTPDNASPAPAGARSTPDNASPAPAGARPRPDHGVGVRTEGGRLVSLRALSDALAALGGTDVSILAELVHASAQDDALVAAGYVGAIVDAIGARERGFALIAAVRAMSAPIEGLPFSRLVLDVARAMLASEMFLSPAIYDRVRADPRSLAYARSFAFVHGRDESAPPSPPLVATRPSSPAPAGARSIPDDAPDTDPAKPDFFQAMRRSHERAGQWDDALKAIDALVELSAVPSERAELRLAQARVALDHLRDTERAFALLQAALKEDPAHERALAAFDEVCAARAQVATLGSDTLKTMQDADQTARLFAHASDLGPDSASAEGPVSDGAVSIGSTANGASVPEPTVLDPTDPAVHASAFAMHWRAGKTDAALLAALSLEELGEADVDQQILVDQFRSTAPIRARGTLDDSGWSLLRAPGSDDSLVALFAAVARAAVATRLEQLVARKRLVALDPEKRLDPNSTASVVRSFQWAARVLGVACPALYIVDDVPGEIAAVRAHEPSTALGPSVLRGRSVKDLAFLAGRHLTYYRPEHQVLVYFPTTDDLTRLLAATIELGSRGPGSSGLDRAPAGAGDAPSDRAVIALRDRLERTLTEAERTAIAVAVGRLETTNGKLGATLGEWVRSVELTAGRAGLLLCGDLATATAIVRSESREIADLSPNDKRHDLLAFCSSPAHADLRSRFSVTAPESTAPPPPPAPTTAEITEPSP